MFIADVHLTLARFYLFTSYSIYFINVLLSSAVVKMRQIVNIS